MSLLQELQKLRPKLAQAAQVVLDDWVRDEDGFSEELGGGGPCDLIAEAMVSEVVNNIEEVDVIDGGHEGDDHAWIIVFDNDHAVGVDIPSSVYETGGGYNWRKIEDITIDPFDVQLFEINRNDIAGEEELWRTACRIASFKH